MKTCIYKFYYEVNQMTFTSKLDWDTDINSVGGQSNVLLVDSPYSNLPSANAAQGSLTYGNLTTEFAPPKLSISSIDNGYYIHSRMNTSDTNSAVTDITLTPSESTPVAPGGTQGKENFKECMRNKTYVAPSRRGTKNPINPARGNVVEAQESYTEIPGLVGSNIHHESFQDTTWISMGKWLFGIIVAILVLFLIWGILKIIHSCKPTLLPPGFVALLHL